MKNKKMIRFMPIALSLAFLFNPNVNVVDYLPDFIGYILLCLALTNIADINETVSDALKLFKKMIIIDAAKILAIFWIFGLSVPSERNSSLMFWSFSFGILEIIFLIPAFTKLFGGLTQLGYLHNNTAIVGSKREGAKKSYTDKMQRLTVVFVVLKSVMSFLPELSDLTSTEYYENAGMTNLYDHIGIMRFLAFVPVLIFGVIWIVRCVLYFLRIERDTEFVNALEKTYSENVAPKKGIFVKRNFSVAFWILFVAVLFSFDFRLENMNILPDTVCAILLTAFFIVISRRTKIKLKLYLPISIFFVAFSTVAYFVEYEFFRKFYYGAIYRSEEAMRAFVIMAVVCCVSTLLFALVSFMALRALVRVTSEHTGVMEVLNPEHASTRKKMDESVQSEVKTYILLSAIATAIYVASEIAYIILAKDFAFMFLINTVCAILMISSYIKLYMEMSEAISSKYYLE